MKLALCGNGAAGRMVLEHILEREDIEDVMVFTHPDTEYGQGLVRMAKANDLWQTTESINTAQWPFVPDVVASVGYLDIVSVDVIHRVGGRIFNAHASLLPRHRGRSPVPWAIVEGDDMTGVTFHYIDEGIDTGPILFQVAIQIAEDETQASLFYKVNWAIVKYWPTALMLVKMEIPGQAQVGDASYHSAGPPYNGKINPYWPLADVERFIRAMDYPPYPVATFEREEIRCLNDYRRVLRERSQYMHYQPVSE